MRKVALAFLLAVVALPVPVAPAGPPAALVTWISVSNGDTQYARDGRLVTTVSPNGDGFRDSARIHLVLSQSADITIGIWTTRTLLVRRVAVIHRHLSAGPHVLEWRPRTTTAARSYIVRVVASGHGIRVTYGAATAWGALGLPGPVVQVQHVSAYTEARSYRPGSVARLVVATDARSLTVQVMHVGWDARRTRSATEMSGAAVGEPVTVDWRHHRSRPSVIHLHVDAWPSGMYVARVSTDDGRVGYAPFVVAPRVPGTARIAVVMPTNTWLAYDFADANGDGYGDSWYAGSGNHRISLARAFLDEGVPPHFSAYDLGFIRWLGIRRIEPDFLSDDDLGRVTNARTLARHYDLIVFPGHEEYVTQHVEKVIRGYRNRGGNLMFLSADNFYWHVTRRGNTLTRVGTFRALGHPEAALIGVQYRAHRNRLGCYTITNAKAVPWLFHGTPLQNGSRLCHYGIEADAVTAATPAGTTVIARIPNLFGHGLSAAMTYYETPQGARVFAAGTLNFGGSVNAPRVKAMFENLWARLATGPV